MEKNCSQPLCFEELAWESLYIFVGPTKNLKNQAFLVGNLVNCFVFLSFPSLSSDKDGVAGLTSFCGQSLRNHYGI